MKAKNTVLPSSPVDIYETDSKATLTLWDGTYIESINTDGETVYEYDIYLLTVPYRQGLADAINANFNVWYTAAQTQELNAITARELVRCENEINAAMPETLLDLDYRLTVIEEFGGDML